MRTYRLMGAAALAVTAFTFVPTVASSGSGVGTAGEYAPVCLPAAVVGVAHCNAIQLLNPAVNWHGTHSPVVNSGKSSGGGHGGGGGGGGGSSATPAGYGPGDLQSAYNLTKDSTNNGDGEIVAIVDAYNDPNAQNDLNVYRSQFGFGSCTTTTGCFTQVNETGGSTLPKSSSSWSEEISLDLDMVSAICPNCKILLVEASSASITDLGTAVAYAAKHADAVSNSYGAAEFSGEQSYDYYYTQGVPITVSAGDNGYGVEYPAASPDVTAVGGTTLTGSASTSWSQTVWSGTGSGCSAYEAIPVWQPTSATVPCKGRTVADTAAVADPNTGVAVYDSFHEHGWMVFGGTSVASPIIASIYALAGLSASSPTAAEDLYSATSGFNPVSTGSNGSCGNYLCNASASIKFQGASGSYNGPTGVGTPNGITGF